MSGGGEGVIQPMELGLINYEGVAKFNSVRRAIRRGNLTQGGTIVPKRPFNNRANTSSRTGVHSRSTNEFKKRIYAELIRKCSLKN